MSAPIAAAVVDHRPSTMPSLSGLAGFDDLDRLEFTVELSAGWAAKRTLDDTAARIAASGLDVSYTDRRHGMLGCTRRFTVRGPRHSVLGLVAAFERHGAWAWRADAAWQAGLAAQQRVN